MHSEVQDEYSETISSMEAESSSYSQDGDSNTTLKQFLVVGSKRMADDLRWFSAEEQSSYKKVENSRDNAVLLEVGNEIFANFALANADVLWGVGVLFYGSSKILQSSEPDEATFSIFADEFSAAEQYIASSQFASKENTGSLCGKFMEDSMKIPEFKNNLQKISWEYNEALIKSECSSLLIKYESKLASDYALLKNEGSAERAFLALKINALSKLESGQ